MKRQLSMRRLIRPFAFCIAIAIPFVSIYSVNIPVFVSSDSGIYEEAIASMQTIVNFETETYYIDIIETENTNLKAWFRDLISSKPPFVITIGLRASRMIKEQLPHTPMLFSMVSAPKSLGIKPDLMCGVSMDTPVSEFFVTLKEIDPNAQRVLSFYSPTAQERSAEGNFFDLQNALIYNAVLVEKNDAFEAALNKHGKNADAILMGTDPLYSRKNFEILSRYGLKEKVIIMTGFASLVKLGSTFALSPDYARIGIQTGEIANRLYEKKSTCAKELIQMPERHSFFLNEKYSEKQGIQYSESTLSRAKNTRLFSLGVNLIRDGKLNVARKIFAKILEKDPENKAANLYQDIVVEKQTKKETKYLLTQAKEHMQKSRFAQAKNSYQKILRINPKNVDARNGIAQATLKQSEQLRNTGSMHRARGNPFEAIRSYLSSLRVLPSNAKTKTELNAIRATESGKIKSYIQEGMKAYNARKYTSSIEKFEDILLIDPNHKTANEYLRLSHQKKEAADRLLRKYQSRK